MTATEIAAWWGAVIATLLLAWDIYKWKRSGPTVNVSASPNMKTFGGIQTNTIKGRLITVEATNTGDRSTTITHLVGYHYGSLLQQLRRKPEDQFFVTNAGLGQSLPHLLPPGERWLGGIEQNDDVEKMSRTGRLYCGIFHTSAKKPVLVRVVIPKNEK